MMRGRQPMAKEPSLTPAEVSEKFQKEFGGPAAKVLYVNLRSPEGHPGQMLLCRTDYKRKIVRAGRRGGKTVGAAILAVEAFLKGTRVLYAAPTNEQVTTFWNEVCRALNEPLTYKQMYKNETKKIIQATPIVENESPEEAEKNKQLPRIKAKTAWDPDGIRGDYAGLLILDEFQSMAEETLSEVGLPMLMDFNGDLVLIYTPPSVETSSRSNARDPQHAAKKFKKCQSDPEWLCIHFPSSMNPHISAEGVAMVSRGMTKLAYRQEILALDTDEVPGALWTMKLIEETKVTHVPCQIRRTVVGIDPSGSSVTEAGIVAVAEGMDGHLYVLRDASMLAAKPKAWASTAISLYRQLFADRIVAERNFGGDMVSETLRNVDETISYKDVHAAQGKIVRAEPICALFEQGKMHIVVSSDQDRSMDLLIDEMCSYVPGEKSPNRMDACFIAGTKILTQNGELPIEQITPGMLVATRAGWKPVTNAGPTGIRRVITRQFAGRELTGTSNHPVFTENRGFVAMDELGWDDTILTCTATYASSGACDSFAIHPIKTSLNADTSWAPSTAKTSCCIVPSGKPRMVRFLRDMTSTMWMKIHSTIGWIISSVYLNETTTHFTIRGFVANENGFIWPRFGFSPKPGTAANMANAGTVNMGRKLGKIGSLLTWENVSPAARNSTASSNANDFVIEHVPGVQPIDDIAIASKNHVLSAVNSSGKKNIKNFLLHVRKYAGDNTLVKNQSSGYRVRFAKNYSSKDQKSESRSHAPEPADGSFAEVFNLEVADQPEYFANGILVHNCVWASTELLGLGMLGLVELYKSGKVETMMAPKKPAAAPATKVAAAGSLAAVATSDQTPKCEKCGWKVLQIVGPQLRCANCGHQQWPAGTPAHAKPLGGRRIELAK